MKIDFDPLTATPNMHLKPFSQNCRSLSDILLDQAYFAFTFHIKVPAFYLHHNMKKKIGQNQSTYIQTSIKSKKTVIGT